MINVNYPWPGCAEWEHLWPDFAIDECVRKYAKETPDKAAVVDPRRSVPLTFDELDVMADRLAAGLLAAGARPGDVVAVQLPNWWEFVALYVAVTRARMVFCPISTAYRRSELSHILTAAQPTVLVVPGVNKSFDHAALAAEVLAGNGGQIAGFFVGEPSSADVPLRPFTDLLVDGPAETFGEAEPNEATIILFTSGSEALPKAVVHTHATANYSIATCSDFLGLGAEDVVLVAAPVTHAAGFNWCLRIALYVGATQVLLETWKAEVAARLIADTGCTFTYAPTRFLQDLLALAESGTPVSIKTFGSGGSPIPRALVRQARELMGCQVLATYGQTECFAATSTRIGDSEEKVASTDGCAVPGTGLRMVDENGNDVAPGQDGMCITRGPHVAAGYLDEHGNVRHFSDDGWLVTGDICTMDEAGYIRVVGRQKQIVIRNGLNISPAEIEARLLELPGVRQAAVVGYPDDKTGEKVCAVVALAAGHQLTLDTVTAEFVKVGVARFKHPERLIVVDEIPHSAIGKVLHREVKRLYIDNNQS